MNTDPIPPGAIDRYLSSTAAERGEGRHEQPPEPERKVCPLQLEVIRRGIKLWSNPGDMVLSPFAGIGSEGHEAVKGGRRFLGVELKESYWRCAVSNMKAAEASLKDGMLL